MEYPNIRSLREDHDFRQCDLASVLHVSQNTYSQYENGAATGTIDAKEIKRSFASFLYMEL